MCKLWVNSRRKLRVKIKKTKKTELPETVVESLLSRNHTDVHGTILPNSIVGQHLFDWKREDIQQKHKKAMNI